MKINLKETEVFEIYTEIDGTPIRIQLKDNILIVESSKVKLSIKSVTPKTELDSNKIEINRPSNWWDYITWDNGIAVKPLGQEVIYTSNNKNNSHYSTKAEWSTTC